jgi:serine/threonine protein phosphatase PrpC
VSGAWVCHTGKVRHANEDACLAGQTLSDDNLDTPAAVRLARGPWIIAVSDGIGGHRGGAEASHTVVSALAGCKRVTPHSITDLLHRLNRHLCERGSKHSELTAMGATIAGVGCGGRGLFTFHVGDSRVYRWENDTLTQITRDDSESEDLIDLGLLERTEGKRPGFLHALTQAIGGRTVAEEIQVHIQPLRVTQRTRFIVCSDGLTDMVPAAEIEALVRAERAAAGVVAALFAAAMEAGGRDNVTIAVVDVEPV